MNIVHLFTQKNTANETLVSIAKLLYEKASLQSKVARRSLTVPYITAADNQFLGLITKDIKHGDSIFNQYGIYGSKYSRVSIFNKNGTYGSPTSAYSPTNSNTSTPPRIIYRNRTVAFLTNNQHVTNSVTVDQLFDKKITDTITRFNKKR